MVKLKNKPYTQKEIDKIWNKLIPIPEFGSLFVLDNFIEYVKKGLFTDWDGSGYYCDGDMYSHLNQAFPSQIKKGDIDRRFSHVIWFNK